MDYSYLDSNHLDSILAIEKESNPYPWTIVNFQDCLNKGYYSLALEEEKNLIGFAIMAISTEESHLLNIGITKEARGQGYGEKLLNKMIVAAEVMVMPLSCSCSIQSIVAEPSLTSPIL